MPVTLTTGRPRLKGGAAFQVIDQIYPIGMAKYFGNVGLFTAKNPMWVTLWGTNLIGAANAAKAMPDEYSRQGELDSLQILLDVQIVDSIIMAYDLSGLIELSYEPSLWAAKKEAAGLNHLAMASIKPSECSTMMANGITFMATPAENAALIAGGMITGFVTGYIAQSAAVNLAHTNHTTAVSNAHAATDAKINAYNAVYDSYMLMARVAKNIFRNDKAVLNGIVFGTIKKTIQPQHQVLETKRIEKSKTVEVANAIAGKPITNIGTLPVTINGTTILAAGDTINNTFGERISFGNASALYPCAVRLTRMVHKN
jgi:hypothetical protein